MRTLLLLLALGWMGCGVLSYGLNMGYRVRRWPWMHHVLLHVILFALYGPISLFVTLVCCAPYRWAWHGLAKESRWEAHKKRFPNLDRKDFERED